MYWQSCFPHGRVMSTSLLPPRPTPAAGNAATAVKVVLVAVLVVLVVLVGAGRSSVHAHGGDHRLFWEPRQLADLVVR